MISTVQATSSGIWLDSYEISSGSSLQYVHFRVDIEGFDPRNLWTSTQYSGHIFFRVPFNIIFTYLK
jgi:hypothetical protein